MKHNHLFLIALACVFVACGSDDDNDYGNSQPAPTPTPEQELTKDERPSWTPVEIEQGTGNSMSVDVAIDLSQLSLTYKTESTDMVAAFIGGTCRDVAYPNYESIEKADSTDCVFLLTVRKSSKEDANVPVELKFYSSKLKHIFTATSFAYHDETNLGTISNPYKPQWQK